MAFRMRERAASRDFKQGLDSRASRQRREDVTSVLRKNSRLEQQRMKRQMVIGGAVANPSSSSSSSSSSSLGQFQGADENLSGQAGSLQDPNDAPLTPEEVREHLSALPSIVRQIRSPTTSPADLLNNVIIVRRLLSVSRRPPITEVVSNGVVPDLVQLVQGSRSVSAGNVKLQFEALWALTNIASGTSEHCALLVKEGAVQAFVRQTQNPGSAECREQAVWALGNMAGDCEAHRDAVLGAGGLQAVMKLIQPQNPAPVSTLRNISWTLSNFCRGKNPLPDWQYVRHAIPALTWLLCYSADEDVVQDAAWGLSYVSEEPGPDNERLDVFVDQQRLVPRLVALIRDWKNSNLVINPVLRMLGNILTGNARQTDVVLRHGGLEALVCLLAHPKKSLRKDAMWCVSNVTAGAPHQIQAVLTHPRLLLLVLQELRNAGDVIVQREAAWALANACSCANEAQLKGLASQAQVLEALVEALKSDDRRVIRVVCEALVSLLKFDEQSGFSMDVAARLEENGGLETLEELQNHRSEDVYNAVCQVFQHLQHVLELDEAGGAVVGGEAEDQSTFGFGFADQNPVGGGGTATGQWVF